MHEQRIEQIECYFFTAAPITVDCEVASTPPTQENDLQTCKYLWVMTHEGVPFEKEFGRANALKHTNLTGGGKAYCGGEVWFADRESIYLNGGSGRYPCEHDEELLTNVKSFYMEIGYRVAVPPFDEDLGQRPRVFKSEAMVEWQQHGH